MCSGYCLRNLSSLIKAVNEFLNKKLYFGSRFPCSSELAFRLKYYASITVCHLLFSEAKLLLSFKNIMRPLSARRDPAHRVKQDFIVT
jgi:hypothetical protein